MRRTVLRLSVDLDTDEAFIYMESPRPESNTNTEVKLPNIATGIMGAMLLLGDLSGLTPPLRETLANTEEAN